jgi:hypothetical protein
MAYTMDTAPANLLNRLAHVMVFMLSKGADPKICNLAGDSAASVGNSLTQRALLLAFAVAAGDIKLEAETVGADSTPEAPEVVAGH